MKNFIKIILFTLVLIIISCSSNKKNDELIVAIGGESTEGYDPVKGWGRYGNPLFQSALLKRDNDLNIITDLAEQYFLSADKKVWTVKIKKDIKFSDGSDLTGRDVVFTYNKTAGSAGKFDLTMFDRAVFIDDWTVKFYLKYPSITFLNTLITLGIVPEHLYNENYSRNPIGSGPYKLISWQEGQQLIVEANPFYYGDKPKINRIVFLFINEDTALLAAKAGKVSLIAVNQNFAKQKIKGMSLKIINSSDNRGIMFPYVKNEGKKTKEGFIIGNNVTSDIAVRKAVNYAINREELVNGILEGFGSKAYGIADNLSWDNKETYIEDNKIEKAKKILTDAGWIDFDNDGILEKNKIKAEFNLLYPASDAIRQNLAVSCAVYAKRIGIKINVMGKSWDEIKTMMHSNAVLFGWGSLDPLEMYNIYNSKNSGNGYYNPGYYKNDTVDKYLDKAMSSGSFEDSLIYWKLSHWDGNTGMSVIGDAPWAWLVNLNHTYFVNNKLDIGKSRTESHGHGWPITANITEWEWKDK